MSASSAQIRSSVLPPCTIVVPCYNEASRLNTAAFQSFVEGQVSVRLLFVNDGSSDETLALLEAMRSRCPERIGVLDLQPNGGKAEAVRRGMVHALEDHGLQYVGFLDADLATPLSAVPELVHVLETHPASDIVFGSRVRLLGRNIERRPIRHYLGRVFATVASRTLKLPIYDTQCGAKLFRADSDVRRMLAEPFLSRWIFDVEIVARAILVKGSRAAVRRSLVEYPLHEWRDVAGSRVKTHDFFRAVLELFAIWRKYLARVP